MFDKLKIGLLDLLTIILPGGIVLMAFGTKLKGILIPNLPDSILTKEWLFISAFLGASYILGHFIFFISSYLDDLVYEKVRRVYWHDHNILIAHILDLKEKATGISNRKVLNAYKWTCAHLMSKEPEIYSEVERYMAESKFFRSLVIVFPIIAYHFRSFLPLSYILLIILAGLLSLTRFLTQRQKSLESAYKGVITTYGETFPPEPKPMTLYNLKKGLLYPSQKLFRKIEQNDKSNRDQSFNYLLKLQYTTEKFMYTVGLCFFPFLKIYKQPTQRKIITESKEVRWFNRHADKNIIHWFAAKGVSFTNTKPRTDFYLAIPGSTDTGIKLREGNIEIKQRQGQPVLKQYSNHATGHLEDWIKWSFASSESEQSFHEIIHHSQYSWVKIDKERLILKLTYHEEGGWKSHDVTKRLDAGWQVEYTRLRIKNEEWYTFALESFGDLSEGTREINLHEIIGASHFNQEDSLSYNPFILKVISS